MTLMIIQINNKLKKNGTIKSSCKEESNTERGSAGQIIEILGKIKFDQKMQ